MASKREEERNERIIRGLMKLPPNRRCINCNNLGPQYVCTNFWTFVCMICSGIHREFTHRVKSVSMSKFTSQDVEALQNGGNQRAREIYLKDWDLERQRLPNSSNVDKVREFIKAVYVDRKYAGGNKSDKPPGDTQSDCNIVEETRRASSYHSYSQSPPYDFQYEDRLKRKQGGPLARKPGSGLFERKAASFAYSPGRFSNHMCEDRFSNEGSSSRVSDYSVSSGGDPFRSSPQSLNLQKDEGFPSPNADFPRETVEGVQQQTTSTYAEAYAMRDADRVPLPRPQRSVSSGSFGSFDINPVSNHSVDAGSFDAFSDSSQLVTTTQNQVPTFPSSSKGTTENRGAFNLFEDILETSSHNSAPGNDLFQVPIASVVSVDMFQASVDSSVPQNVHVPHTFLSSSSSYVSEISQKSSQSPSVPSVNQNFPETSDPSNGGWATFDLPQHNVSITNAQGAAVFGAHSEDETSFTHLNSVLSATTERQWPDFQNSVVRGPALLVSNLWNEQAQNFDRAVSEPDNQPWKAFEDDSNQQQFVDVQQGPDLQVCQDYTSTSNQHLGRKASEPWKAFEDDSNQQQFVDVQQGPDLQVCQDNTSTSNQHLGHKASEGYGVDGFHKLASGDGGSFPTVPTHANSGFPFNHPVLPFMGEMDNYRQKPGNPFDIDAEFEVSNAFLDMSSLQVSLPSLPLPSPYVGSISDSWFHSSPVTSQGGIPYMTAPPSSSQLPNVSTHGSVASLGGNPFA